MKRTAILLLISVLLFCTVLSSCSAEHLLRPALLQMAGDGLRDWSEKANTLLNKYGCKVLSGDILQEFATLLNGLKVIGILYIGNTPQRAELLDMALRYTNDNSLIVVEGICHDEATKAWWQTVIDNPSTIITYDLYSYGLLYFNKERIKQHYTLKK